MEIILSKLKNNALIGILIVNMFLNCEPSEREIEYFEDSLTVRGKLVNNKKQGNFTHLNEDGKIMIWELYSSDTILKQIYYTIEGDTDFIYDRGVYKEYFKIKHLQKIKNIGKYMVNSKSIMGINFDTSGNLIYKHGTVDFLTNSDSVQLDKDYPDWKSQVKEWKE